MTATADGNDETRRYHHPDLTSTRIVTDAATGDVVSQQNSLPFGTSLNSETTGEAVKQKFTSYEREATGLDYAVNRTYDSGTGRFTQVDPLQMGAATLGNPQSLNLYSYVQNDPVNFVDPSGLFMLAPSLSAETLWWFLERSWYYDHLPGSGGSGYGDSLEVPPPQDDEKPNDELIHCDPKVDAQINKMLANSVMSRARAGGVNTDSGKEYGFGVYIDGKDQLQTTEIFEGTHNNVTVTFPKGYKRRIAFFHNHHPNDSADPSNDKDDPNNDIPQAKKSGLIYYTYVNKGLFTLFNGNNPTEKDRKGKDKDRIIKKPGCP